MEEQPHPKRPWIYYAIITMFVVTLMNAFIFPQVLNRQIIEVDYGTFLNMIESGQVNVVEIQDLQIAFTGISDQGEERVYVTVRMDDPELVSRLHNADVRFSRVIPRENSMLMNFILTWILPIIIFFG